MAEKKTKIKIAVGIDGDVNFYAIGGTDFEDDDLITNISDYLPSTISISYVEFELLEQEIKTYRF